MVEWIEKAPNWEVKNFRQLSQQIFGAEDDEPASDSNLVLLHQHTGDYIDSEEEMDLNPKDPPASKSSNSSSQDIQSPTPSHARKRQPSFLTSDDEEEAADWVTKRPATSPTTGGPGKRVKHS
ncbi:hypothetical protein GYMLUDRAFT_253559 [Collybiopsis luxurians FD-317 M1]|uniref:Unplaced genomic scaffold GYMLUscaffold_254, whole genome shotgun sequence n=1 Tax=Collybiopsis luxurians FD-317 M1 TaxID=944289 RepID=A0A0D0AI41_9AGAR|nr:hypothetical protein GYMLUDRAFT_253559 [Collybiopsis luxurians FD-317 M1]